MNVNKCKHKETTEIIPINSVNERYFRCRGCDHVVIVPKKVVAKISASRVDELIAQIGPEFFRNIDSLLTFIGVELEELLEMRSQFRRKNGGEDPAVLKIPKVHVMGSEVVFAPINRPMFDSKND